jgi:molybdopterin-containing oxidoreductase family iron-sulfur binding subunit
VRDLRGGADVDAHRRPGPSIVIAGETQPPAVHALAQAINAQLGNFGRTVLHIPPVAANATNSTAARTIWPRLPTRCVRGGCGCCCFWAA